jgi:cobalt-zinc-cadmium efflux system membrane fusion protein
MSRRALALLTVMLVAGIMAVVWGAKAPEKTAMGGGGHRHERGAQGHGHDHKGHGHQEDTRREATEEGATKEEHAHGEEDGHGHAHDHEHGEEPLVRLSEAQQQQLGIALAVAQAGTLETSLTLPGTVGLNTERVVRIVPRIPGVVRAVRKRLGDAVRAGEVLAVIDSRELADAKASYLAAGERVTLAESTFLREKGLWEKKISPEQDYLEAKQALTEARIELQAAKHKLQALGLSAASLKQLASRPEGSLTRYEIVSPLAGTLIEKTVTAGELLKDDTEAFVVADLSTVWVTLQVPPTALSTVQRGQRVVVSAGGMMEAEGNISYVAPVLLEETRTAATRVELPNPDGRWRPGLFVTATITSGDNTASVLIPKAAVQTIEGRPSVFVKTEEGFSPRPVTLGRANETHVEVVSGLSPGERYAATETFILKAELAKGEASHQH